MKKEYSFKDGGLVYLFAVAFMFVASLVLSMLVGLIGGTTGQDPKAVLNQNWAVYLNAILSELAFFLVYIIYTRTNKIEKYSIKNIDKKTFDLRFLIVFVLAVVIFFASLNFTTFFNRLFATFATYTPGIIPLGNFGEFLLSVLCFAVIPAIAEELIFRGIIFSSLKNKIGVVWAVLVSSLAFTLIHFSIFQTIHQFLLGAVLALIFYFTGKLIYSMFFHFCNNFFVVFFVYVTGNQNFGIFTNFGATEIVLTFFIFILGAGLSALGFYFLNKLTKKKESKVGLVKENVEKDGQNKGKKRNYEVQEGKYSDVLPTALYVGMIVFCVIVWAVNSFKGGL